MWETQLLRNIQIQNDDIFEIVDCITKCEELYITSDGSAPNFVGTYGWAAKTKTGTPIATNNGPAPGFCTTSFRSEAYGMLSVLLFLYHLIEYSKLFQLPIIKLYTDSQSLIDKVLDMVQWPDYYSSATLTADWDVLQAIVRLLKTFSITPLISHAKSH